MAKPDPFAEPSDADLKEELRRRLLPLVTVHTLANEIADLVTGMGRKPGTAEKVGSILANKLISKFAKLDQLEKLIENRPRQLHALLGEILREEYEGFFKANPKLLQRRRAKIATDEERKMHNKAAKNRYERRRRYTGRESIEGQFGDPSPFLLGGLLEKSPPPWGPCLDDIFRGGRIKMCDDYKESLQSLFDLHRKKLAPAPQIRVGREVFYDYRAVLRCMDTLLKHPKERPHWLPNPDRRRTVLTGILSRAQQQATPEIREAFEKTLRPYLD